MKRSLLKSLAWLLILAVLVAGVDAAVGESLHAGHAETSLDSGPGNTGEADEHVGHCCHAAGHLIGAVSGSIAALIAPPWISLPAGASSLSEPGQAPPTPPPTR
jgi:hypothetical protein